MTHCISLTPEPRSAPILFTARLTTDVSTCAISTPSEVAISTRMGGVIRRGLEIVAVSVMSPSGSNPEIGTNVPRTHPIPARDGQFVRQETNLLLKRVGL